MCKVQVNQKGNGVPSERERTVAQAAANGLSNDEIAQLLDIDRQTVKVHLRALFKKLGIKRRSQIVEHFPPQRQYVGKAATEPEQIAFLNMMVDGLTNRDLADKLSMTTGDVVGMIRNMREGRGFHHRHELAMWWAIKTGRAVQSTESIPSEQQKLIETRGPSDAY